MAKNYNRNKQVCRYHISPMQTNRKFATQKLMFLCDVVVIRDKPINKMKWIKGMILEQNWHFDNRYEKWTLRYKAVCVVSLKLFIYICCQYEDMVKINLSFCVVGEIIKDWVFIFKCSSVCFVLVDASGKIWKCAFTTPPPPPIWNKQRQSFKMTNAFSHFSH